ncbi:hypothetical protein EKH55_4094 [Sinorhizobium alkalisoli]|nr:hypothetical protein EKH55_4094 [Sinorhizobium alkalisoli]
MIRAAGSSGTAAISWVGGGRVKTTARSGDGMPCGAIWPSFAAIASRANGAAARGSARRCFNGLMTAVDLKGRSQACDVIAKENRRTNPRPPWDLDRTPALRRL